VLLLHPPGLARSSQAPGALQQELLAFLAARVAKHAVPDGVVIVSEIPHSATGKVSKLALRSMFKDHRRASSRL
jgi:fatty-acyl-CoA synthase